MTSSAPPNPSPVPVPVPVPTPIPTANGTASPPKEQPPPPPQQQQQQGGGQEEAAAADGGGAEAAEAGVAAGVAPEAMEVDGGSGAGDAEVGGSVGGGGGGGAGAGGGAQQASPATVFRIRLKQSPASLRHKMRVPELCRNFRCAWLSIPALPSPFPLFMPKSSVCFELSSFWDQCWM
jgi:hypothetical protein